MNPLRARTLGALALLALLPNGCAALRAGVPTPSARISGVGLENLNLSGVTLRLDVAVTNPYGVDLPVRRIQVGLSSRGQTFLTADADTPEPVAAHATTTVPVPVTVSFHDLLATASEIEPGAVVPYRAELRLSMDAPVVGLVSVPVSHDGEVPVPAPPTVSVAGFRWDKATPTDAKATVSLNVGNTNTFPVSLSRLDYHLNLAGVDVTQGALTRTVTFAAQGSQRVDLAIDFSPIQIGAAAVNLLGGSSAAVDLKGQMDLDSSFGSFAAPFEASGNVALGGGE